MPWISTPRTRARCGRNSKGSETVRRLKRPDFLPSPWLGAVGRLCGFGLRPECRLALLGCGLLATGCGSAGSKATTVAAGEAPALGLTSTELETRRLFRVSLSGEAGQGSMRLALALSGPDSYAISASDALGRSIWDLVVGNQESYLIDHRRRWQCDLEGESGIPQESLRELSLRSLPAVLLGFLPVLPDGSVDARAGKVDFVDDAGRRWTARSEGGKVDSWTLWKDGEPAVWWSRRQRGGLLSHRQGSQLRWRETLVEALSEDYRPPTKPAGYTVVVCDETDLPEWSNAVPISDGPEG